MVMVASEVKFTHVISVVVCFFVLWSLCQWCGVCMCGVSPENEYLGIWICGLFFYWTRNWNLSLNQKVRFSLGS